MQSQKYLNRCWVDLKRKVNVWAEAWKWRVPLLLMIVNSSYIYSLEASCVPLLHMISSHVFRFKAQGLRWQCSSLIYTRSLMYVRVASPSEFLTRHLNYSHTSVCTVKWFHRGYHLVYLLIRISWNNARGWLTGSGLGFDICIVPVMIPCGLVLIWLLFLLLLGPEEIDSLKGDKGLVFMLVHFQHE